MPIARSRSGRGRSSLAARLTLAFVGVTLLAVLMVTGLAMLLGGHGIDRMVADRRADLARSLAANAEATYLSGQPGWTRDDWRPALDLAIRYGTDVAIMDTSGKIIASTPESPFQLPEPHYYPIVAGGQTVGTVVVAFTGRLADSAHELRGSLITAVLGAACLAALLAAAAALEVSRRLSAPLMRLINAADSMGRGVNDVRVGPVRQAPREVRDLAATFDTMADTLVRQEQIRRAIVADVAHELRTPVAILQANLEALSDEVISCTPAQIKSLHEEAVRLADRVDDLQALARADAAAVALCLKECDLAELAASAVEQLPSNPDTPGVEVVARLSPTPVRGDPARIHQVITNLLMNAAKFTEPSGSVHITVEPYGAVGRIVIQDSGRGISPEDLTHVFDRFWRSAEVSHIAGSGIGLTIVAQLVRAHGGTVEIASTPGVGTTVTVTLPGTESGRRVTG